MYNSPNITSPERPQVAQVRQKRSQVARACDGCRIHRAKCDAHRPCSNCKSKGRHCSNSDNTRTSTLSQAYEEIRSLRHKLQEVETKLEEERRTKANLEQHLLTPRSSNSPHVFQPGEIEPDNGNSKKKSWEGIVLRPPRSPHDTWFGPSSQYYFIKRLSVYLTTSLQQAHSADHMLPASVGSEKLLEAPNTARENDQPPQASSLGEDSDIAGTYLSPTQEEYFIDLFWQSYHTSLFAIIDEAEFKQHHQSLWMTTSNVRKPSALVDIVLAMCMQYAVSSLPGSKQGNLAEKNDATIAGRRHYRRCQKLLTYETESPTISTLQCQLLCGVYLCGGSFHNMVDNSCSLAVRTAYMLGLHLEPPPAMPQKEREQRRRLWWAVYLLDSKSNMKLGRPFLLRDSHAMPRLPSDTREVAILAGSTFAPLGDNATWLSFNLHQTTLYMAVRAAHTVLYDVDLDVRDGETIWDQPQALEACAQIMQSYTKNLEEWAREVPNALKTIRQNDGRPLSTHNSALEIEKIAPLWLQRQRLLLELTYHNLCLNLYRPFISFFPAPASGHHVEEMATTCAAHAVAYTNIAHQVLSSTSILDGWHEVFQWQWNAAMTLAGFVLTYPHGPSTLAARSAIDRAVLVFDIFGENFEVAASAAKIVRDLCPKVDFLREQHGVTQSFPGATTSGVTDFGGLEEQPQINARFSAANINTLMDAETDIYGTEGQNQDLFDMALSVDFWADFDMLWPETNSLFEN